jgi:hypothetical protein
MSDRKPFIIVHQKNVEELDSLDDALRGIDETRVDYHQGGYRIYDFEAGIYKKAEDGSTPNVKLSNQTEYDNRFDDELRPFAVVEKHTDTSLIGTTIGFQGKVLEIGKDMGLPETVYHGFDTFNEARADFEKRKDNEAGLYSLVAFHKVAGPDRKA